MFSPLQSIMHDGGSDHVDSLRRSTSMKLELDSVVEFTSGFQRSAQHGRAVIGRGAATANHRRRCFAVFPQKPSAWGNPPLYALLSHGAGDS